MVISRNVRTSAPRRLPSFDAGHLRSFGLSRRELEVLELVAQGATNVQAAERLGISPFTVKKHLERMYAALGARNRAELIALTYERSGLVALTPLRRSAPPRHNLPGALTSFLGREREIQNLTSLLATKRLVTLGGPGGVGKTRLSLEVGAALLDRYPDGVWLVELGDVSDPRLVLQTVSTALGVRESGRPRLAELIDELRSKRLLLLLDNCEHLVQACAAMVEPLLRACPELRVLATSRETLGVAGELFWPVPSLSLPDLAAASGANPAAIGRSEAVRLFAERASLRRPGFALTATNAHTVAHICRRLDGMPLAIELAAARLSILSVEEVAARLDDRFKELRTDAPESLPRHRTLRGVVEWSYQLLGRSEARLFERLSVFAGGCALDAAEAVCAGGEVEAAEVLDLLSRLVDKSFVIADVRRGETRYRSLETLHAYGRGRMEASGEAERIRAHHAAYLCTLAEEAEPELRGGGQAAWLDRLETDHDNLRAALGWAIEHDPEVAQRLAGALWRFWFIRGHAPEGLRWLEQSLAAGSTPPSVRGKALNAAGNLAHTVGDAERSETLHRENLAIQRALGNAWGLAGALSNLGDRVRERGDLAQARALYLEALPLRGTDPWGLALTTSQLGHVALNEGDLGEAGRLYAEALALWRNARDPDRAAHAMEFVARVEREQGRIERAETLYRRSLIVFRALGDRAAMAGAIARLSIVADARGDRSRAARLFAAASVVREELGAGKDFAELTNLSRLREAFAEPELSAAWAEGREMTLEAAVAYGLARQ